MYGQPIHCFKGDVQTWGHFFQKSAGSRGTFPVHFKTGSATLIIQFDDFVVLTADIDNGDGKRVIKITALCVAADFGFGFVRVGNILTAVTRRDHALNVGTSSTGHFKGCFEAVVGGCGKISS